MARIRVEGREEAIEVQEGASLLSALRGAQSPISTSCGGHGTCGYCRLTVLSGKEHLDAVNAKEIGHLGNVAKIVGIRLACQATVVGGGDIEINVPEVVDIAARKREQTRRGFAERASRRRSVPGAPPQEFRHSGDSREARSPAERGPAERGPTERIEWRPSRLGAPSGDGKTKR